MFVDPQGDGTSNLKYLDLREVNRIPAHVRSGKPEEVVRSWWRQLTFIPTNHVQCSLCVDGIVLALPHSELRRHHLRQLPRHLS